MNGYALVMIDIVEQNQFTPQIIETTGGGLNTFSFLENTTVGTRLAAITLEATDADSSATWYTFLSRRYKH